MNHSGRPSHNASRLPARSARPAKPYATETFSAIANQERCSAVERRDVQNLQTWCTSGGLRSTGPKPEGGSCPRRPRRSSRLPFVSHLPLVLCGRQAQGGAVSEKTLAGGKTFTPAHPRSMPEI